MTVSHENFITLNYNYVYIKIVTITVILYVSKSFYYSTEDVLLRNVFTNILSCCDIYFTYILYGEIIEHIREHDCTKYLVLFHFDEKYERIFDRIRYLIILKSNISDIHSHQYTKIKISSGDDLPLEKTLNMHDLVILIKSVVNKNHNHYCYQVFLKIFHKNNI